MRRCLALVLLAAAGGCSNAPLAGFLDLVHPSHVGRAENFDDPLHNAFPPAPSAGPPSQPPSPPITPPLPPVDSGFAPRDATPPPASRPSRDVGPLTLPNT